MKDKNYFDHQSPTYGSPFDMMKSFGISYKTAGENIAKGQKTPEEVVKAWMNSEGHRKNILNPNFTHIGVGYVESGSIWTQQFIGK
ncbi:YkwD protein [Bacillus subtilis]|nr:YkwD protein [Bacillus subtilis]